MTVFREISHLLHSTNTTVILPGVEFLLRSEVGPGKIKPKMT